MNDFGYWEYSFIFAIYLALFCGVYAFLYFTISYAKYSGWKKIEARLIDVYTESVETIYSFKNPLMIKVKYEYTINNKNFIGERVNILDDLSLISNNYSKNLYKYLTNSEASDKLISVFVDKSSPEKAIIDRSICLPYFLLFILYIVLGVGGVFLLMHYNKIFTIGSLVTFVLAFGVTLLMIFKRRRE